MFDAMISNMEKKFLETMGDRLQITTEFDEVSMMLKTITTWDGLEVSVHEYDLTPFADAIIKRMQ